MTVLTVTGAQPSPVKYTYTGPETSQYPNGTPETVTVNYSSYTVATNFGCSGVTEYPPTASNLVSSIALPDGTAYTLTYEATPGSAFKGTGDVTGRIATVGLPTGGSITYQYTGGNNGIECADGTASGLIRTTLDGAWTYTRNSATTTNTVQDPAGNQSTIQFAGSPAEFEVQRNIYEGSSTLLETVTTCYSNTAAPCTTATFAAYPPAALTVVRQPAGGKSAQVVTYYGEKTDSLYVLDLPTEIDTYDFGATAPTQVKKIAYASFSTNILDRPSCVQVTVGSNSSACGTVTSSTKSLTNYTYFSNGNLEQASSWTNGSNYLNRSYTYYPNGLLETAADVNSTVSTPSYQNCNGTPAYLSSVTAGGLTTSYTWDCYGGGVTEVSDANSQSTQYGYVGPAPSSTADPFWRVLSTTDPLGNVTWNTYTPATSTTPATQESALNFNTSSSPTSTVDTLNTLDGLGRLVESQKRTAPNATTFDSAVQYTYGWTPSGTVTGPFTTQTVPGGTALTTTQLDALGRTTSVADGGGGTLAMVYTQNDVLRTVGPAPSGEKTKQKQLEYDAFGRITSVCEETSTLFGYGACAQASSTPNGYFTKYVYDSPANTISVTQNAQPGAVGGAQTRTYTFDGVGRLTSESNPETGTTAISYTYDSDSTCGTSDGDLVKKVDAAGNVTCYAYDALHRKTGITYPSGPYASSTPAKTFVYDATTFTCTNPSGAFVEGRLAEAFTGPSTAKITDIAYCYSPRGEIADAFESTPNSGGYYHTTAGYWANGVLNTLGGVPGLNGWTFAPDGEGRPYSATYGASTNWIRSATYYPSNAQTTVTFGTGDSDVYSYDATTGRMNGFQFTVGSSPKSLAGTVGWNADWTLGTLGITDAFNASNTQNCTYGYDALARSSSVACTNSAGGNIWGQTFTYDAFGNITKNVPSGDAGVSFQPNYTSSTNQFTIPGFGCNVTYDSNGNLTNDCEYTYAWDAGGNAITVDSKILTYDAMGRQVETTSGSTHTQILYSPIGKLGLMTGQTAKTIRIPLPGGSTFELIGATGGTQHVLHADWLGSSRLSTNYGGRSLSFDTAYAPFGEYYAESSTSTTDLDFTGQFDDTESSDLYDFLFRKYVNLSSRWISPDPAGLAAVDFSNPQSWNRYAYVQNSPMGSVDPIGLACFGPQRALGLCNTAAGFGGNGVFGSNWDPFYVAFGFFSCEEGDCGWRSTLNGLSFVMCCSGPLEISGTSGCETVASSPNTPLGQFINDNIDYAYILANDLNTSVQDILGLSSVETGNGTNNASQLANNYFSLTVGPAFSGTNGSYTASTGYQFGAYPDPGFLFSGLSFASSFQGNRVSGLSDPLDFVSALTSGNHAFNSEPGTPQIYLNRINKVASQLTRKCD
ncbi:MAG: RHS repeat-associated core domain-containing protein [Candidatus Sulfotelmatobacter sp.]